MTIKKNWNATAAIEHYRINNWGMGLFSVNSAGHVIVKSDSKEVDLYELSKQLRNRGTSLPVLVRFPHILQYVLSALYSAFQQAISAVNYQGNYIAAYPIKVNQQATVIQHFHDQTQWPIAFEVGSKAELIACLGIIQHRDQTIICNGYKDEAYIRLALLGLLLGNKVIIVLESLLEFQHVLRLATELNVTPVLGMRLRLSSIAEGNWQNTGGKRSKFGFTSNEALQLVDELKTQNVLSWLKMLHFHMGSQIPSLQHIRIGVTEGMRYFSEMINLGVDLTNLNVGGGLGVDYEGSKSNSYFSINYTIKEYASTIVEIVNKICEEKNIQAPTLFSENGRVMTAYHAVLLTNVINSEHQHASDTVELSIDEKSINPTIKSLIEIREEIKSASNKQVRKFDVTKYHDELTRIMKDVEEKFSNGLISLHDKAHTERIFGQTCQLLLSHGDELQDNPSNSLEKMFIDKYFCNFSLFQSTPDIWGLNQIFPILPLHRLNEMPQQKVRLHDLTCDSDGQINRYVENNAVNEYLSLHKFEPTDDYVLGLFLVGAYQEILGDMHNLFGDTNAVNVVLKSDGGYHISEEEHGDTVEEVLSYVHIDIEKMRLTWLQKLNQVEAPGDVRDLVLQELESSLQRSSYLTHSST